MDGLTGWRWWGPYWGPRRRRCRRRRRERAGRGCRRRSRPDGCSATPSAAGWRRRRWDRRRPATARRPSSRAGAACGCAAAPPSSADCLSTTSTSVVSSWWISFSLSLSLFLFHQTSRRTAPGRASFCCFFFFLFFFCLFFSKKKYSLLLKITPSSPSSYLSDTSTPLSLAVARSSDTKKKWGI